MPKKVSGATISKMEDLEKRGVPRRTIAKKLGVSEHTIRKALGKYTGEYVPLRVEIVSENWLTTKQALEVTGYKSHATIRTAAQQLGWDVRVDEKNGLKMYRKRDVYALAGSRRVRFGHSVLAGKTSGIVKWADSLVRWPSEDEIARMVTDGYGVKNIVSILENREERHKGGKWVNGIWVYPQEEES